MEVGVVGVIDVEIGCGGDGVVGVAQRAHMMGVWFVTTQCSGDEVSRGIQDGSGGGGGRGFVGSGSRRGGGKRFDDGDRRRRGSGDHGNRVKVRGLPFSATDGDVSDFFREYEVSFYTNLCQSKSSEYFN